MSDRMSSATAYVQRDPDCCGCRWARHRDHDPGRSAERTRGRFPRANTFRLEYGRDRVACRLAGRQSGQTGRPRVHQFSCRRVRQGTRRNPRRDLGIDPIGRIGISPGVSRPRNLKNPRRLSALKRRPTCHPGAPSRRCNVQCARRLPWIYI
jgi:hypothetical protein